MESIVRRINLIYYLIYTLTIVSTVIGYVITFNTANNVNPTSALSINVSSVVIIYLICSIPTSLYLFHRYTKKLITISDEFVKLNKYATGASWRLFFVGFGLVISVIAFYILRTPSMIFCAGIAALSLFFCKPSEGKIIRELELDDNEE